MLSADALRIARSGADDEELSEFDELDELVPERAIEAVPPPFERFSSDCSCWASSVWLPMVAADVVGE